MALAGQVTNPERLEGRDVSFQSDGTAINGYLVRPREPGSYPGIIVIHEAWGVIEHIRDVARRFANLGYVVLAPDLYTRVGAPKTDDPMNVVLSRMLALSDAQLVRDLDKAADLLASQPGMTGKIGCVRVFRQAKLRRARRQLATMIRATALYLRKHLVLEPWTTGQPRL